MITQETKSVWIWPHTEMTEAYTEEFGFIEDFFDRYYAPFKTLYFSRGRVAITAILEAVGASRNDLVFTQPYSSYCVQSAISRVATPLTIHPEESKYQIVYHNFGKKALVDKALFKNVIIEDSVDSVITCNSEEELFPNGGDYAVFSLAKMIHVPFGSIVVCRTEAAYERLKNTPMRQISTNCKELMLDEPVYVDSFLANNPKVVSSALTAETLPRMFKQTVETIWHNVEAICALTGVDYTNPNRLPSNVFSEKAFSEKLYNRYKVEVRERNVYDYEKGVCKQVHLFPVHADIWIEK